jgi:hypothetical protein
MKRSEIHVGDEVVVGTYGRRAVVISTEPWEKARGFSNFRVSPDDLDEHLNAVGLKDVGPKYACLYMDSTDRPRASFRKIAGGAGVLVKSKSSSDGFRIEVTTLGALRPAERYDEEQRQAREARANADRAAAVRRERVSQLPAALGARVGQFGDVRVSLDALEKICAAAATLDDLVALDIVTEDVITEVNEMAAEAQLA